MTFATIWAWFQTNGIALAGLLSAMIVFTHALQKFIDLFPNHVQADTFFGGFLRVLEAIAGIIPAPAARPTKKYMVRHAFSPPPAAGFIDWRMVMLCLGASALMIVAGIFAGPSCATVAWDSPVFYAGPTVAPIEEITLKNPQPATAAGFQATIGLGQFDFSGKNWDALDLSVLALGGVVLPSAGPAGMLQVGAEVGTLNGIIGLGILTTPYTANNEGYLQGGGVGLAFAGMLNVAAITTWLGSTSEVSADGKYRAISHLPRGGLGGQ